MDSPKYTISFQEIYKHAFQVIQPHLELTDHGYKCKAHVLLKVLFYAAAHCCSIFAACGRLRDTPSDQAIRNALQAFCPVPDRVEGQLNRALACQVSRRFRRRRWRLAIDLTLIPYHGQPKSDEEEVYRSQAKSGTTHFHAYATCCLVHRGQRFTVALTYVKKNEPMKEVLQRLLRLASQVSIRPELLLLDREFYSVDVIRYLQAARYPFLMPAVRRGRKVNDPRGPSGTNVFAAKKQSGWFDYTLTNANKRKASVRICVHCRNTKGQHKRKGRQALIYAFWGIRPKRTEWVYQTYRQRFGIETSYRQMNEARIKTTTRNPALRLLFFGIAIILRNVWVWVHFHVIATPRRGGRKFNLEKLRFLTILLWLAHVAVIDLGLNDVITVDIKPDFST